eukprot:1807705-Rhodomonas_salina.1
MHLLQNCSDLTNPSVGHRVEESEQSESPGPRAESDVRLEVRKEARLFMRWDSVTAGAESGHVFELRDWDTRKLLCSRIPQSENSYIPCSRSSSGVTPSSTIEPLSGPGEQPHEHATTKKKNVVAFPAAWGSARRAAVTAVLQSRKRSPTRSDSGPGTAALTEWKPTVT